MGRRGWGRKRTLLAALLALALGLTWLPAGAASKYQWGPKAITLRTGGQKQPGNSVWLTWSNLTKQDTYCATLSADYIGGYPDAVTHQLGEDVKIRLVKRRRPSDASITGYRAVDGNGQPVGPSEDVPYTLERHRDAEGKTRAWHLVFEPVALGDLYLDVYAEWDDGCGLRDGLWLFHIQTAPADPPA